MVLRVQRNAFGGIWNNKVNGMKMYSNNSLGTVTFKLNVS